jgi:hypothetical protein
VGACTRDWAPAVPSITWEISAAVTWSRDSPHTRYSETASIAGECYQVAPAQPTAAYIPRHNAREPPALLAPAAAQLCSTCSRRHQQRSTLLEGLSTRVGLGLKHAGPAGCSHEGRVQAGGLLGVHLRAGHECSAAFALPVYTAALGMPFGCGRCWWGGRLARHCFFGCYFGFFAAGNAGWPQVHYQVQLHAKLTGTGEVQVVGRLKACIPAYRQSGFQGGRECTGVPCTSVSG